MTTITIEQVRERLHRAVARAEAALEMQVGADAATDSDALAVLEAAHAENAALRAVNDDISARLETAIGRLKAVLEGAN